MPVSPLPQVTITSRAGRFVFTLLECRTCSFDLLRHVMPATALALSAARLRSAEITRLQLCMSMY